MNNRFLYIIITILLLAIIHPLYNYDRLGKIRSGNIHDAVSAFSGASELYDIKKQESLSAGEDVPGIESFISIISEEKVIPAAIIKGSSEREIQHSFFNEDSIKSQKQKNEIKNLFRTDKAVPRGVLHGVKKLFNEDGNESIEVVLVEKKTDNATIMAVYRVDPDPGTVMMLAFENALIFSLIISGTVLIYIVNARKKTGEETGKKAGKTLKRSTEKKEKTGATRTLKPETDEDNLPDSIKFDPLNRHIYNLFSSIYSQFGFDELSLYIHNKPGMMNKVYELKGNRLIKIEGGSYDSLKFSETDLQELKNSPYILTSSGRILEIPLKKMDSLPGLVKITSSIPLTSEEIEETVREITALSKPVSDLINIKEVMIDPETGLLSESYIQMRLLELKEDAASKDYDISVLMLSLFSMGDSLSADDKNIVLKTLAPTLKDMLTGREQFTGRYDDMICVIINRTDSAEAEDIAHQVQKELSRFRIKLTRDHTVNLSPSIGISSLKGSTGSGNLIAEAAAGIS